MAHIVILEGARLSGKSTIARHLRNNVNYSTLINMTGFKETGEEGKDKITRYYRSWVNFFNSLPVGGDEVFILDRFAISEVVYSRLYKDYDFMDEFLHLFEELRGQHKISIAFIDVSSESLIRDRASRRKKALYKDIEDNVQEVVKQRNGYRQIEELFNIINFLNVTVRTYDPSGNDSLGIARNIIKHFNL